MLFSHRKPLEEAIDQQELKKLIVPYAEHVADLDAGDQRPRPVEVLLSKFNYNFISDQKLDDETKPKKFSKKEFEVIRECAESLKWLMLGSSDYMTAVGESKVFQKHKDLGKDFIKAFRAAYLAEIVRLIVKLEQIDGLSKDVKQAVSKFRNDLLEYRGIELPKKMKNMNDETIIASIKFKDADKIGSEMINAIKGKIKERLTKVFTMPEQFDLNIIYQEQNRWSAAHPIDEENLPQFDGAANSKSRRNTP